MGQAGGLPLALLVGEVCIGVVVLVEEGAAEGDLAVLRAAVVGDEAETVAGQGGYAPFDGVAVEGATDVDVLAAVLASAALRGEEAEDEPLVSTDAQVRELLFNLGPVQHGAFGGPDDPNGSCDDSQ